MRQRSVLSQVKSGFVLTAKVLLMIGWLGLVIAGVGTAFGPAADFNHGPPPRALGWLFLVMAAAIFFVTMDRWVKVFPGLTVLATMNSILVIGSGHAVNNPQVRIPRLEGVIMTVALGASALVSVTFTKHTLTIPDRMALFAFVCCVFWSGVAPRSWLMATIIMVASLVSAWTYDRRQRGAKITRPTAEMRTRES